ncbi:MAG: transcriptional regulator [Acidimicrobiales bacterium]|nr:transcriptional regulator [Acidimicrobiales bacterium]
MGVNDYGRYCPVAIGSTVLADRWTPLILRELVIGSTRFNDIARGLPGLSRSLLSKRLRHLERHGIVTRWSAPGRSTSDYHLTPAGEGLGQVVVDLGRWAVQWQYEEIDVEDVEATTLMWWMHRFVQVDGLPAPRLVIQFDHTAPEAVSIWIVIEEDGASVCMRHPGYEPDAIVRGTTPSFAEIFLGEATWTSAVKSGTVTIEGPAAVRRRLGQWFLPGPFSHDVRSLHAVDVAEEPHLAGHHLDSDRSSRAALRS